MMLMECRDICDYLIVGLQTDPTIDRPDKNHPVLSLDERYTVLSAIKYVDRIFFYDTEHSLYLLLQSLHETHPDMVRILGADWKGKEFTGHDLPIQVHFNNRDHGFSSSSLRERVYLAELTKNH